MTRPQLLAAKRAARYLGVSVSQFHRWRKDGLEPALPPPVANRGATFYVLDELDAFVGQLKTMRGQPAK